jgi:TolB-like protein/DNA-binding winged helix-turn-helix (wHTH) protein/Flp pilus assembly protein TadD
MPTFPPSRRVRFGPFVADFSSFELFKHGIRLKLQDQPFQIMRLLIHRCGDLVTREELRKELWTESTFVDFDAGLNAAVRRLRDALNDSAEAPHFIETVPRHGYRFIADVEDLPERSSSVGKGKQNPANEPEILAPQIDQRKGSPAPVGLLAGAQSIWFPTLVVVSLLALLFVMKADRWKNLFVIHASTRIQSLAVIPLQNLSGDSNQDYFADGVTDALITDLAQIKSIRVISGTSSMQYKATKKSMPQIGKELKVDAVVEGAITREGDRVRISAQLIQASADRHLWAKSFEGNRSDILSLEANVARELITEIHKLTPQENTNLTVQRAINPDAYDDVMLGRFYQEKRTSDGLHKSLEYFQRAIAIEPEYAEAYAGLADSYGLLTHSVAGELPDNVGWPKSKAAATKAIDLAPNLAAAHASLGRELNVGEDNPQAAEKEYRTAIDLDPNYSQTYIWYSALLSEQGHKDEALQMVLRAQQVDPLNANLAKIAGDILWELNKLDEAAVQFERAIELDPTRFNARVDLADVYFAQQRYPEAFAQYQKAEELSDGAAFARVFEAIAYHKLGKNNEAEALLEKMKEKDRLHPLQDAYVIAVLEAELAHNDAALQWLEEACQNHSPGYREFATEDAFQSLHSDPRFIALTKKTFGSPDAHK